jgi:hypothetical protein
MLFTVPSTRKKGLHTQNFTYPGMQYAIVRSVYLLPLNVCSYTTSFCTVKLFINTFFAVKCANNTRGPSTGEVRDWQP